MVGFFKHSYITLIYFSTLPCNSLGWLTCCFQGEYLAVKAIMLPTAPLTQYCDSNLNKHGEGILYFHILLRCSHFFLKGIKYTISSNFYIMHLQLVLNALLKRLWQHWSIFCHRFSPTLFSSVGLNGSFHKSSPRCWILAKLVKSIRQEPQTFLVSWALFAAPLTAKASPQCFTDFSCLTSSNLRMPPSSSFFIHLVCSGRCALVYFGVPK